MPSSFILDRSSVTQVMAWVLVALLPGIAAYIWLFGPGILITLSLASTTALLAEADTRRELIDASLPTDPSQENA